MEELMMANNEEAVKNDLFGFGDKNVAFAKYFIGDSYLNSLISADDNIDVHVANISFEPDCRNNWHVHHNGYQLLLVSRLKSCTRAMPWQFTKGLSTGTGPPRTLGLATSPSPRALRNGWKKFPTSITLS
jgi:hypothetical protein